MKKKISNLLNKIITHFKIWNVWRKKSMNGKFYKLLVLFKLATSPTFEFEKIAGFSAYKKHPQSVILRI